MNFLNFLTDPVVIVVGDHDEEVAGEALRRAPGYKHVLRPAAAAVVELLEGISSGRPPCVHVPERLVERDGHWRLLGTSHYVVHALTHFAEKG